MKGGREREERGGEKREREGEQERGCACMHVRVSSLAVDSGGSGKGNRLLSCCQMQNLQFPLKLIDRVLGSSSQPGAQGNATTGN